jgi:hypothetical protein
LSSASLHLSLSSFLLLLSHLIFLSRPFKPWIGDCLLVLKISSLLDCQYQRWCHSFQEGISFME